MAEKTARIIFEAVDKATGTINSINERVKIFENTTANARNTFQGLSKIISDVLPWASLGAAMGSTISLIKSSITAWEDEEISILKLRNAVSLAYDNVGKANEYFENMAQKLQVLYGVADSTGRQMIQLAVRFGAPTSEIERLIKVATNMSRVLGTDLQTTIRMIIRAGTGYTTFLRRMGIIIDENVVKQKGLSGILDELEKKFSGLSDTYLNTLQGSFTSLKDTVGDLQEVIGEYITENSGLITILQYTIYILRQTQEEASGLGEVFKGLGWIIGAVGKSIILVLDSIVTGFKELGNLIAGVVSSIYFVLKRDFKGAGEVIKQTFSDIKKIGNDWIDRMTLLYTNNATAFRNMTKSLVQTQEDFTEKNKFTTESIDELTEKAEKLREELQKQAEQIQKLNIKALVILTDKFNESRKAVAEFNLEFLNKKEPEVPETYTEEIKGIIVYQDEIIHKTMEMSRMITDAFMNAAMGVKSFGDAMKDLLIEMGIYISRALIMTAITQTLFTLLGIKPGAVVGTLGAESLGFGNLFMRFLLRGFKEGGMVYGFKPLQFQEGGVVTRPTLAIVGEGGEPEYIIPQSKLGSFQPQIQVVIHNATPETYVEVFTRMGQKEKKLIKKELLNA